MRLLVTGGRTGYLGRYVVAAAAAGHEVVAVGSADADVRDAAAVESLVERHRPDAIVHTAYVQSDRAVTADGAAHVAGAAARHGARMVLVSSDVVFGGSDRPYDETAPTDPVSPYGEAKVAAERAVLDTCADAVVARTSLILGDGASQHEELVRRLAAGADGALFEDERRCPVHVEDLARALVELAEGDAAGRPARGRGRRHEPARARPAHRASRRPRPRRAASHDAGGAGRARPRRRTPRLLARGGAADDPAARSPGVPGLTFLPA